MENEIMIKEVRRRTTNDAELSLSQYLSDCKEALKEAGLLLYAGMERNGTKVILLTFQHFNNKMQILFSRGTVEFSRNDICIFRIHSTKVSIKINKQNDFCEFVSEENSFLTNSVFLQLQTLSLYI